MNLTIIAFIAGFIVSIAIKYMGYPSEYNMTSIAILIFSIMMFGFFGDIAVGNIAVSSIITFAVASLGISAIIGVLVFLLYR